MITALTACSARNGADAGAEATTSAGRTATEAVTDTGKEGWYKEVLADKKIKTQYLYYRVLDINLDGEDELFLSTTDKYFIGDDNKACLMAYVNGQLKVIQEIGGAGGEYWIFKQSDATLSYFSRLSGESHLVLYKYADGELKELSTADSY